jgi:HK97 gp10 family phage protein
MRVTVRAKARGYKSSSRTVRKGLIGLEYQHFGPLFYARFLEFGTGHQPAYPFLTPAWDDNKGKLPEIIAVELAKAIDRTMNRLSGVK